MHYGKINKVDSANGPGVRVSLFVSGCRNHCPNCFNQDTWAFDYGTPYTQETEDEIIQAVSLPYIDGITILGGEPFEEENQETVMHLLSRIHRDYPQKDIWCYTGYTLDRDLCSGGRKYTPFTDELLSTLDVLVDGRYVEELKDYRIHFRGSSNQRLIDMKETLKNGSITLLPLP